MHEERICCFYQECHNYDTILVSKVHGTIRRSKWKSWVTLHENLMAKHAYIVLWPVLLIKKLSRNMRDVWVKEQANISNRTTA